MTVHPAGPVAAGRSSRPPAARPAVRVTSATGAAESLAALTGRTWSGLAALGAGLVTAAVASGHLGPHPVVGGALVAAGLGTLVLAVLLLRGPVRRARLAVAALLTLGPAVLVSAPATGTVPGAAEAAALALALGAGVALAGAVRAGRDDGTGPRPRPATALGQLLVLASGALLVAVVTVPGLAATSAGEHAVPHGSHGLPADTGHAGH